MTFIATIYPHTTLITVTLSFYYYYDNVLQEALDRLMSPPAVTTTATVTTASSTNTTAAGKTVLRPTIILVAHRLSTVINADVIAVIDQGKILERYAGLTAIFLDVTAIFPIFFIINILRNNNIIVVIVE